MIANKPKTEEIRLDNLLKHVLRIHSKTLLFCITLGQQYYCI